MLERAPTLAQRRPYLSFLDLTRTRSKTSKDDNAPFDPQNTVPECDREKVFNVPRTHLSRWDVLLWDDQANGDTGGERRGNYAFLYRDFVASRKKQQEYFDALLDLTPWEPIYGKSLTPKGKGKGAKNQSSVKNNTATAADPNAGRKISRYTAWWVRDKECNCVYTYGRDVRMDPEKPSNMPALNALRKKYRELNHASGDGLKGGGKGGGGKKGRGGKSPKSRKSKDKQQDAKEDQRDDPPENDDPWTVHDHGTRFHALMEKLWQDWFGTMQNPPDCVNINLYEDGSQTVGWHADDESLFDGKNRDAMILSLSLGSTREFWISDTIVEDKSSGGGLSGGGGQPAAPTPPTTVGVSVVTSRSSSDASKRGKYPDAMQKTPQKAAEALAGGGGWGEDWNQSASKSNGGNWCGDWDWNNNTWASTTPTASGSANAGEWCWTKESGWTWSDGNWPATPSPQKQPAAQAAASSYDYSPQKRTSGALAAAPTPKDKKGRGKKGRTVMRPSLKPTDLIEMCLRPGDLVSMEGMMQRDTMHFAPAGRLARPPTVQELSGAEKAGKGGKQKQVTGEERARQQEEERKKLGPRINLTFRHLVVHKQQCRKWDKQGSRDRADWIVHDEPSKPRAEINVDLDESTLEQGEGRNDSPRKQNDTDAALRLQLETELCLAEGAKSLPTFRHSWQQLRPSDGTASPKKSGGKPPDRDSKSTYWGQCERCSHDGYKKGRLLVNLHGRWLCRLCCEETDGSGAFSCHTNLVDFLKQHGFGGGVADGGSRKQESQKRDRGKAGKPGNRGSQKRERGKRKASDDAENSTSLRADDNGFAEGMHNLQLQ